jgi:hypothetical protein
MALQTNLLGNKRGAGVTKILLLSFAVLLASCTSQEERLWQQYAREESSCTKNFPHGTESYWNCRRQLDRLRTQQQKNSEADVGLVVRGVQGATGVVRRLP